MSGATKPGCARESSFTTWKPVGAEQLAAPGQATEVRYTSARRSSRRVFERSCCAAALIRARRAALEASGSVERCAGRCRRDSLSVPTAAARAPVLSCSSLSSGPSAVITVPRRCSLEPWRGTGCRRGGAQRARKGLCRRAHAAALSGPPRLRARLARAHQAAMAPQPRGCVPMSSPGSARGALALQLTLACRAVPPCAAPTVRCLITAAVGAAHAHNATCSRGKRGLITVRAATRRWVLALVRCAPRRAQSTKRGSRQCCGVSGCARCLVAGIRVPHSPQRRRRTCVAAPLAAVPNTASAGFAATTAPLIASGLMKLVPGRPCAGGLACASTRALRLADARTLRQADAWARRGLYA